MTNEIKQRIEQINNGEVPEGYTHKYHIKPDLWMDEPLDAFFYKVKEKNSEKKYNTVFTNSATNGVIPQSQYFEKDIANEENIDGYYIVRAGDYIYNPRISEKAPYGPINQNLTGCTGIASPLYTVFSKKENVCICDDYIRYYLDSAEWNKYIYSVANYGARFDRMNISDSDFMNMPIALPPFAEQQKIAEILMQCDKVIEFKQKRIDEEKRKKQAMLKKVFVNNNSIEYSLCNLCTTIIDGDWIESKDQSEDGIRLIQTGNIGVGRYFEKEKAAKYISDETFKTLNCTEVFDGDVLVSRLPDPIGRACMIRNLKTRAITAVDCTIMRFKEQLQAELFLQYATTQEYFNKLQSLAGGSTRTRISRKELEKLKVKLPKEDKRARLINDLFKQQDRILITLEKELEQWQQKKKSLMQLLLTGIVRVKV